MKTLILINFLLLSVFSFAQKPTLISGTIVDENNRPVANAMVHFGRDTAYSDMQGRFKVNYPNPQQFFYNFYFERADFLPKSFFVDLSDKEIILTTPIVMRSRSGFWYDPKQIDRTHIGITVKEAIKRYKLDIDMCLLWDEPPGAYQHFTTELADSSYACFTFKGMFVTGKRLSMTDILKKKITGIGISFTNGDKKMIGKSCNRLNPYLSQRQMKIDNN